MDMMLLISLIMLCAGFTLCLFTANPTFLIVWLILMSLIMGMIFLSLLSTWMTYAVILLFTGGMMILFSYMLSLTLSSKINFFSFSKVVMMIWLVSFNLMMQPIMKTPQIMISTLFSEGMYLILIILAIYLLLILLSMVKVASSLSGPMKSFFLNEL